MGAVPGGRGQQLFSALGQARGVTEWTPGQSPLARGCPEACCVHWVSVAGLSFIRRVLSTSCMPSIPESVQGVGSVVSPPRGPSAAAGSGARRTESRRRERRVRGGGLTARRVDTQASQALGPLPTCPLAAPRGACPQPSGQSRTQQPPSKPASSGSPPSRRPPSTSFLQPGEILRLSPAHSP